MTMRVGDHDYRIEFVTDLRNDAGESLWGQTDPRNRTIRFCDSLRSNPTKRVATTLHEAIHLIEGQRGIELAEREVRILANSLAGFLIHNEWLRPEVLSELAAEQVTPDPEEEGTPSRVAG